MYEQQTDQTYPESISTIYDIYYRCKSIVLVRAAKTLTIESDSYINNFVVDSFSPYPVSVGQTQSNALMVEDMDSGSLSLTYVAFSNH